MSYAEFEGTIPKGEYGGGTVMLWDRGTWAPIAGKNASDIDKGHLHFCLEGERMRGEWLLVRLKGKASEKRENCCCANCRTSTRRKAMGWSSANSPAC